MKKGKKKNKVCLSARDESHQAFNVATGLYRATEHLKKALEELEQAKAAVSFVIDQGGKR